MHPVFTKNEVEKQRENYIRFQIMNYNTEAIII